MMDKRFLDPRRPRRGPKDKVTPAEAEERLPPWAPVLPLSPQQYATYSRRVARLAGEPCCVGFSNGGISGFLIPARRHPRPDVLAGWFQSPRPPGGGCLCQLVGSPLSLQHARNPRVTCTATTGCPRPQRSVRRPTLAISRRCLGHDQPAPPPLSVCPQASRLRRRSRRAAATSWRTAWTCSTPAWRPLAPLTVRAVAPGL